MQINILWAEVYAPGIRIEVYSWPNHSPGSLVYVSLGVWLKEHRWRMVYHQVVPKAKRKQQKKMLKRCRHLRNILSVLGFPIMLSLEKQPNFACWDNCLLTDKENRRPWSLVERESHWPFPPPPHHSVFSPGGKPSYSSTSQWTGKMLCHLDCICWLCLFVCHVENIFFP